MHIHLCTGKPILAHRSTRQKKYIAYSPMHTDLGKNTYAYGSMHRDLRKKKHINADRWKRRRTYHANLAEQVSQKISQPVQKCGRGMSRNQGRGCAPTSLPPRHCRARPLVPLPITTTRTKGAGHVFVTFLCTRKDNTISSLLINIWISDTKKYLEYV